MDVYTELNVKTYLNAWDTISAISGSRMDLTTILAMKEASLNFVSIAQLQEKVGEEIAKLTDNEAAFITNGASSSILAACAGLMTGGDREKIMNLPDTTGLKDEVIIMRGHINPYDHAVKVSGGTPVIIGNENSTTIAELIAGINDKTCAVLFFDIHSFVKKGLPLLDVVRIAHERGVKVFVDGAAQLPPKSNLWYYTKECGADLAFFSGGKGLRGPQQSGLIVGRKDLIDMIKNVSAPMQGVGRSSKVGREEIIGLFTALKLFLTPGEVESRVKFYTGSVQKMQNALEKSKLFTCQKLYPGPTGQSYTWLKAFPTSGITGDAIRNALIANEVGIYVGGGTDNITLNALNLKDFEVDIVIENVIKCTKALVSAKK